jgi:hypothetical protein
MPSRSISKRRKQSEQWWRTAPQRERIAVYLQQHRRTGITPAIAREVLGVQRLAARVEELRKAGIRVITHHERDEAGNRYARYVLR